MTTAPAALHEASLPMGATPAAGGGWAFRVFAPFADAVDLELKPEGDGPSTFSAMARRADGTWEGTAQGAQAGQAYKFRITRGSDVLARIDPYARHVTNSVGYGLLYDSAAFDWQDDSFALPPHNALVIYEMHIGSFVAKAGDVGGFQSALHRLGHLKRLGINAIQIMPVAEFAGDLSWGYNPAHIFAVESAYGGPDRLKTFVREAHKHGIAVILDVVYNHFGPSDLDLWRFDGWSENDGGGLYFYNDGRSETPWGRSRPDYGRGEVRQFIRDNARMWVDEYRMDGLRFDMTLYIRSIGGAGGDDLPEGWSLLQWVNDEVRQATRHAITIAEDLRGNEALTGETAHGGAGFHAQWDANFVHPVRAAVIATEDGQRSMDSVRDAVLWRYNDDAFRRVIYSESHDEVANGRARVPYEIAPHDATGWFAQKRSTLAAALVFTAPGIPMIFQGQEFLQGEWFRDDVPLDWDLRDEFHGIVRLYRDMIRLRRNAGGTTAGLLGQHASVFHVNQDSTVCAFQRWDQHGAGDDVVVVLNFADATREGYEIGLPAAGTWRVRLNSDSHHYSNEFGNAHVPDVMAIDGARDGLPAKATLTLPPYSFLVLSQDKA